jgi:hypothetical protein
MIPSTEVSSLRYAAVGSYTDRRKIIYPNVFAQPSIIANFQIPREFDLKTRFDIDALPNPRAESPQ